jgi:endoglucanase
MPDRFLSELLVTKNAQRACVELPGCRYAKLVGAWGFQLVGFLAVVSALLSACGYERPSAEEARSGMAAFEDAMLMSATQTDPELARMLERSTSGVRRTPSGFVHRFGTRIVDGAGQPLSLKGVNLGGAFHWEAWIWGAPFLFTKSENHSESHMRSALTELVGAEALGAFAERAFDRMAADDDFKAIAAHGFNVVRIPVNHRLLEPTPFAVSDAGFAVLDRLLARAEAQGVYVVIDLQSAPGGQAELFTADPAPVLLWDSEEAKKRTVALWKVIAARYRDRTVVAGYDLLNEPNPPNGRALLDLYQQIVAAIRSVDRNHLLIIEGADYSKDFSIFTGALDPNQAWSFHIYTWFGEDPRKLIDGYAKVGQLDGTPVWCGEFGENKGDLLQTTIDALDGANPPLQGWAFWTWKKVSPNVFPALHAITAPPAWKKTIDWIVAPSSLSK